MHAHLGAGSACMGTEMAASQIRVRAVMSRAIHINGSPLLAAQVCRRKISVPILSAIAAGNCRRIERKYRCDNYFARRASSDCAN